MYSVLLFIASVGGSYLASAIFFALAIPVGAMKEREEPRIAYLKSIAIGFYWPVHMARHMLDY